ncbi:MAG: hypothetical protein COV44_01660 [Deltaproteobacteria bacterium CG11_big_fil_rev_8_21_14_0_20_45_16]|nr:MAG: hypothetical protein COV44_01660 [Deltaproteobacteria bacterium CG11_big_fil_rev_8_21_14_0_20_45_16]
MSGERSANSSKNLFEFSEARDWLAEVFRQKKMKNSRFSLRAWSKQLGFSSSNMLSMILRKERRLGPETARRTHSGRDEART